MTRIAIGFLALLSFGIAQTNPAALAARQWRQQHERAIVDELIALLSIPNIATDRPNILRQRRGHRKDFEAARRGHTTG
jgi:hypothetical protein